MDAACLIFVLLLPVASAGEDKGLKVLKDVVAYTVNLLDTDDDLQFLDEDDVLQDITNIFEKHEFDEESVDADGLIESVANMLIPSNQRTTFQGANFGYQILCYQGRDYGFFKGLRYIWGKYQEYGCYCGAGKSYGAPLDDTDRCCQIHDACYVAAAKKFNITNSCEIYTTKYTMTCCKKEKITKCNDGGPSPARAYCDCDQAMAKCVSKRRTLRRYNCTYKHARRTQKCRIRGKKPTTFRIPDAIQSCLKIQRKSKRYQRHQYGGQGSCPNTRNRRYSRRWW